MSTRNGYHKGEEKDEKAALATFARLCEEQNLLSRPYDSGPDDALYSINDETTLLRFLRARQLNSTDALNQFLEATQFRRNKQTLTIYDRIRVEDFEAARGVYPHWIGRRDKRGLPICFTDAVNVNRTTITGWKDARYLAGPASASSSGSAENLSAPIPVAPGVDHQLCGIDMLQLGAMIFDNVTRFVLPLCSAISDRRLRPSNGDAAAASSVISSAVIIVDASSLTLMQGFDLRGFARDISGLLTTCYPETVDRIFVCNCPTYFAAIWKVIKSWVDPVTAAKLVFLSPAEVYPTLSEYIADEDLPVVCGGKLQVKHGMLPDLDEEVRRVLKRDDLVPGPLKWVFDEKGKMKLMAVGSVDGRLRNECVATLEVGEGGDL